VVIRPALVLLWLASIVILVGAVNFVWFLGESASIGGDALNGYSAGGQYYVSLHGTFTEVSRETWEWSRAHAMSVLVTQPLAILGMAYVFWRSRERWLRS
jgi:hypothetical protein